MEEVRLTSRLKELREDKGISQDILAELIGVCRSAYGHYETGDRQIPLDSLIKIARYFDVTVDYLLGISDTKLCFGYPKNASLKN